MNGQFDVLSTPGRGSTFRFTVEMQVAQQPVKRPQIYRVGAVDKVLIVDDNASARDILSTMVTNFGMRTDAVDSGAGHWQRCIQLPKAATPTVLC